MNGTHVAPDRGQAIYVASCIRAGLEPDHGVSRPSYRVVAAIVVNPRDADGRVHVAGPTALTVDPALCYDTPLAAGYEAYRIASADEAIYRCDLEDFPGIAARNGWDEAETPRLRARFEDEIEMIRRARDELVIDLERHFGVRLGVDAVEQPMVSSSLPQHRAAGVPM